MATSGKLAELFIDLTLRGGSKIQLVSLKRQADELARSMEGGGKRYRAQIAGQMAQLEKIVELEGRRAKIEAEAYNSPRGRRLAQETAQVDIAKQQAQEIKNTAILEAKYGKVGAMAIKARNAMASSGAGGMMGGVGSIAMAAGPMAAAVAAIFAANHAARTASPDTAATFDSSLKLVTMEIGQHLVPALIAASSALQGIGNVAGNNVVKEFFRAAFRTRGFEALSRMMGGATPAATQPAQFQSFEQGWRTIQQQAASRGPLEERMLEIQLQQLEALRNLRGGFNWKDLGIAIADIIAPGAGGGLTELIFGRGGNAP